MNKIYIFLSLIAILISSCSDDYLVLENPNRVDSENFFKNEGDVTAAVNGVYSETQRFPQLFNLYLSEGRSNNYYSGTSNAQRDIVDISRFNVTSELKTLEEAWKYGFSVIGKANKVLSVIDGIEFNDETIKTRLEAEVRFLRAYSNFELTRTFGEIPLITDLVSPEEALTIGRAELVEVYAFIEEDLQFAVNNLDDSYTGEDVGRITKLAAKGMLAKVYLTWGQYPLNDSGKLNSALNALKTIIADGEMRWSFNFSNLFKVANDNKYSLFEIQYISGPSGLGATFPSEFLSSSMKEFSFNGGVPRISPSEDLVSSFDESKDWRFNPTFDTTYVDIYWQTIKQDIITKWFESGVSLLNRSDWPHNYPILRPGEIYLMHAEAEALVQGSPTSAALESINKIRKRAGLVPLSSISLEEFESELLGEYRKEFVGEGVYWHYLVRSGKAVTEMNNWFTNTKQDITITEDNLIYPVPYSQMVIKPGLYEQNPGY